jgi:hypothetical protein
MIQVQPMIQVHQVQQMKPKVLIFQYK